MDHFGNSTTPLFSISTAAQLLGISVHTLRMYEAEGLFVPFKTKTNQRRYSPADIERIRCVRRAIREEKMSIPAIKRMYSLIPCWEIVGCTDEEREACEAFRGHSKPCWTYRHKGNRCEMLECRECKVYEIAQECGKIKESIIHASGKGGSASMQPRRRPALVDATP